RTDPGGAAHRAAARAAPRRRHVRLRAAAADPSAGAAVVAGRGDVHLAAVLRVAVAVLEAGGAAVPVEIDATHALVADALGARRRTHLAAPTTDRKSDG